MEVTEKEAHPVMLAVEYQIARRRRPRLQYRRDLIREPRKAKRLIGMPDWVFVRADIARGKELGRL